MRKQEESRKKTTKCPWNYKKCPKKRMIKDKIERDEEKKIFKDLRLLDEELSA